LLLGTSLHILTSCLCDAYRFRWVACQLEALRDCLPASLRDALRELPETLDETYERILQGIKPRNREYAHRLLQCITVAIRPLHVEELAEVLAIRFETGMPPEYHSDWRLEDAQDAVILACSSLISIISFEGTRIVEFSHFSVKEFLTSDRLSQGFSLYRILPQPAHTILAQACLCALLRLDDKVDKDSMKEFPLSIYAAQHWVQHAQFENVSSNIQELIVHLFDPDKPHFATWVWIFNIDQPWDWVKHMSSEQPTRPETPGLYYAALCGFHGVVEHLIASCPQDINSKRATFGTPLHAALINGHFEIALILLEHGADVNALDHSCMSPLRLGSEKGRRDIVEFLLNLYANDNMQNNREDPTNALAASGNADLVVGRASLRYGVLDVNLQNNAEHWTPLMSASVSGNPDIVHLLLQNGAAVESRQYQGRTPLMLASKFGYLDTVQLLLQHGANVNSRDNNGQTPLMIALQNGRQDTVQLLLNNGAAVNSCDKDGWTPLMEAASRRGGLDSVQLLLQNGATVNSRDNEGYTALSLASVSGHLDTVRLLLQNGAAADIGGGENGFAPLHFASANKHLDVVQELLDHNATLDIRATSLCGATPLHLASYSGELDVARFLIERGADMNSRDDRGRTPLHFTAQLGHLSIAQLLLHLGGNVYAPGAKVWSPPNVISATSSGSSDVAQLLIQPDADLETRNEYGPITDFKDRDGCTPLHLAARNGHLDIVKLLVDSNADINTRDADDETPLDAAVTNGKLEVASFLAGLMGVELEAMDYSKFKLPRILSATATLGTNSESRNLEPDVMESSPSGGSSEHATILDAEKTALFAASEEGNLNMVRSLLSRGANVNEQDHGRKETPLHAASRNGRLEVVKLLIQHGADVNSRDRLGRVPLHRATVAGHLDVVRVLLDQGADVNAAMPELWTSVHNAAVTGRLDIVELLLERGANVHLRTNQGMTPYEVVLRAPWLDPSTSAGIARFLLENGG
jgi:ankyrin repeat protein